MHADQCFHIVPTFLVPVLCFLYLFVFVYYHPRLPNSILLKQNLKNIEIVSLVACLISL